MHEENITVLVVDDHAVVRKGIRALLDTETGIEVVGEAANGLEAVAETERLNPHVVLMDLVMPELGGVEAIRRIRSSRPETHVVVLTSFGSDDKLFPAVKAGAIGYLLKDARPDELIDAIRGAARGQTSLTREIASRLLREISHSGDVSKQLEPLTEREIGVLREVARGLRNDDIADRLCISEATVRTHISNVLAKLNLSNRTQAALYALRKGIASLDNVPE